MASSVVKYVDFKNDILFTTHSGKSGKDYRYYTIIMKIPWITLPLIRQPDQMGDHPVIDLYDKHEYVIKMLISPNYESEASEWIIKYGGCSDEELENDESIWTSCGYIAEYISFLWGYEFSDSILGRMYFVESTWDLFSRLCGVFQVEAPIGIESHVFVIWITEKYINIYQGYGGTYEANFFTEEKKLWFGNLVDFNHKYIEPKKRYNVLYYDIFRLSPEYSFDNKLEYSLSETIYYKRIY